ncbi:carbohydrate ABC transporter permease [Paramicrobacterium sp. CJ85]|uniref:carbohydrate ABC transporter permease n=1 Tax=Paramicrobacterium sp. CJ85 TaxID=3445355 RepID=UPI003F5ED2E0
MQPAALRTGAARWVLGAPLLIVLVVLVAYPLGSAFWTSFTDNRMANPDPGFVGLDNYKQVLTDHVFWSSLGFTALYTVVATLLELVLGIALALMLFRVRRSSKSLLTFLLLPIMVAPSLMGVMFRLLLNDNIGLGAYVLSLMGYTGSPFSASSVVPTLIILDVMQWTPLIVLIVYSGLLTIPTEVLEAARVDGASWARQIVHIVLPLVRRVIIVGVFLRGIDAFRTFDVIYILTGGGPGTQTTTLSIYVYKAAFSSGDFGLAVAAAFLIMLIVIPVIPSMVKRLVS